MQQYVLNKLGVEQLQTVNVVKFSKKNTRLEHSTGKQVYWKQVSVSWLGMKEEEHPWKTLLRSVQTFLKSGLYNQDLKVDFSFNFTFKYINILLHNVFMYKK